MIELSAVRTKRPSSRERRGEPCQRALGLRLVDDADGRLEADLEVAGEPDQRLVPVLLLRRDQRRAELSAR